jgi:hypothetical protein
MVKQYSRWEQYNRSDDPPEWVEKNLWFTTRLLDHTVTDIT